MKWEYATTKVTIDGWQDQFREYGQAGWELVSVDNGIAYFKRAISKDKSEFKSGMVWRTMTPEEIAVRDAK